MSDIGSMRIENEVSGPVLIAPEIPVRPNTVIPVLVGLILVLVGVIVAYDGYFNIQNQGEPNLNSEEEAVLLQSLNGGGEDITAKDVQDFHDDLRHAKYYWYMGVGWLLGGMLLFAGGVQLLRKKSIGAKLGLGGNGVLLATAVITYNLSSSPAAALSGLTSLTYLGVSVVSAICSLCCGLFAAFPILHRSGKASLDVSVVPALIGVGTHRLISESEE